jgi:multidrug efflux pump subunit AcrA (membrane-fusion protein)
MPSFRRLFRAGQILAVLLLAAPAAAQQPTVKPEPVLERCLVSLVEEAKVSAGEAGLLVEVTVKPGDTVTAGQAIAKIDDDQPQMEKRKAQAEYEQAFAKSESDVDIRYAVAAERVAEAESNKAKESHTKVPGSVTEVERERLKLNEQKSELQIEQAQLEQNLSKLAALSKQVEVQTAEINIKRRLITSPLDGVVVDVLRHQGEWMQLGEPLAHLVRTDRLRVEGYVDAAKYDPEEIRGRPVTVEVRLANDRRERFEGKIVFVSPLVESGGDYRVFAEVPNRKAASGEWLLRAGQTASMTIHSR